MQAKIISVGLFTFLSVGQTFAHRPNILIIDIDDMGLGTSGIEGCRMRGLTPNIDKLGSEGMLFSYCYNASPMSGPSRNAMLSGRYPHSNGVMGHGKQPVDFWQQPEIVTPRLSKYLHDQYGYYTVAILKNSREIENVWDVAYQELPFGVGEFDRSPDAFYKRTGSAIKSAQSEKKPFFIYANPIDPHDPWPETKQEETMLRKWNPYRKCIQPDITYSPEEVEVPVFLPDLPVVRKKLVNYYRSLHRGDECVGGMIRALQESGEMKNTLVIFLSDNGMDAPGGKNTLTPWGVRTPLIIEWPSKIKQGRKDNESIISTIDIVPTILDAIHVPPLHGIEGKSFYDVINGKRKKHIREYSFTAHTYTNQSDEANYFPMRSIIDKKYCYIWNLYPMVSDKKYQKETIYLDFLEEYLDGSQPSVTSKINTLMQKPIEEFYDLTNDPGCWNNLASNPAYFQLIDKYRYLLKKEMKETKDPEGFKYPFIER
jgi:N-sulfoglucosamine sulfohydrolase